MNAMPLYDTFSYNLGERSSDKKTRIFEYLMWHTPNDYQMPLMIPEALRIYIDKNLFILINYSF